MRHPSRGRPELIKCSDYEFDHAWSSGQRRFYFEVRKLMCCTRKSHRELSRGAEISKDSVLRLLAGQYRFGPRESTLRQIYKFATSTIDRDLGLIAWEHLVELRLEIAGRSGGYATTAPLLAAVACPQCRTAFPSEPAESTVLDTDAGEIAVGVDVPVPLCEGDRHIDADIAWPSRGLLWPPASDLAGFIVAGQLESSSRLIHHVGTDATPEEAASAVIACRDLELLDAVDAIISYAGLRADREILQILRPLLHHERLADADALLNRALSSGGQR
ncbi:hypothetical protein NCAST_05_02830 [Nocardia asteroides NBRC 15531]|uniref:Uncharacterized protein n=1 Tax=Nocardia asteroides NBRC 15531 TaxID=1110697 RepID=U5E6E6_NOCAS|nr:hypothetical protein NCAST_05_02830 [Nocardia asteroides NBRC 15531]